MGQVVRRLVAREPISFIVVKSKTLFQVNTILSDTNWDLNVEDLRPIRNRFCELVGVQPPAIIKKPV